MGTLEQFVARGQAAQKAVNEQTQPVHGADQLTPAQEAMRELAAADLAERDRDALFCIVCQGAIPEARARRQTATCSETCKNKLDVIRARQRASKRCPHCLNPSTEEERADYRAWRASRGDRQTAAAIGRDSSLPSKVAMRNLLKRCATALQDEADRLLAAQLSGDALAGQEQEWEQARLRLERLTTLISDCKRLTALKGDPA